MIDLKVPQSLQDNYARDYSTHWSHHRLLTDVGHALNKLFLADYCFSIAITAKVKDVTHQDISSAGY